MATEEATEMATAEPTEMATAEATEMATAEPTEMATAEATEMATAEPTEEAGGTSEAASERIEVDFVRPLSTVEEVDDIENLLHNVDGIISIRGNEIGLTITYDPSILTPDDIRQQMSNIGHPVKP
jgi:copper chaperone CopZ